MLSVHDQANSIKEEGCAFKNMHYGNEERGKCSKTLLMVAACVYKHVFKSIHPRRRPQRGADAEQKYAMMSAQKNVKMPPFGTFALRKEKEMKRTLLVSC